MDSTTTPAVKAVTSASFSADVMAESARQPVLVHFLSPRSEACRSVQVALERAAKAASDKVKLVTMDVDAHPQIAARLGVRAVPAVFAFQRGQPIDGFMGALPEAEIKGFIERLVGPLDDGFEEVLAEAEAALGEGDVETAAALYSSILDQDPEHLVAAGGLARTLVTAGDIEGARALLDSVPAAGAKDKAIVAARAALDLAAQASEVGDLSDLTARVAKDPDDHQARFDLAVGLAGQGRREEAADMLLASLKRDRAWNDGAARKQLLQFFEAWGLMDPVTQAARRKLSALLFS
jgi:putative thioredoxin